MTEEIVESLTGKLLSQDCTQGNRSIQQLESLKAGRPGFRFEFRRVGPPHAGAGGSAYPSLGRSR